MATRQQQSAKIVSPASATKSTPDTRDKEEKPAIPKKTRKLSYKLQSELDGLPAQLEQLEANIDSIQSQINQPDFFSLPVERTNEIFDALQQAEMNLEQAFARWEELEAMKNEE